MARQTPPFRRTERHFLLWVAVLWTIFDIGTCFLPYRSSTGRCPQRHDVSQRFAQTAPISAQKRLALNWFPRKQQYDDDIFNTEATDELEEESLNLLAALIRKRLDKLKLQNSTTTVDAGAPSSSNWAYRFAKGRFVDLTCTEQGERVLESLFADRQASISDEDILLGAVTALQSLCIMGTQVGVAGSPEKLQRMVAHLEPTEGGDDLLDTSNAWSHKNIQNLKYNVDQTAGTQLLAVLKRKRTSIGAFDLLVELGAWERHENLALLRSGFPIRFSNEEEAAASEASTSTHDPDEMLGIRQDFRHHKVYTIDSASTNEIDDGLSVEVLQNDDGSNKRHRFWIHIADADRWAPRDSKVFRAAERRATSLYLPTGSIPMFPKELSTGIMSLKANQEACALSLGVELNDDGSIDASSLIVTPSKIRVSYRLSFVQADEMLEEGVGYHEEWELGAMMVAATKRRLYRMNNGSSEAMVPRPIPQGTVTTYSDKNAQDGIGIAINIEATHNAGKNQTADAEGSALLSHVAPVSNSFMLVTEMMILAGEAIGRWKMENDHRIRGVNGDSSTSSRLPNRLELLFRSQAKPDFQSRARERRIWDDLLEHNVGNGYCHAWYSRRFFQPGRVSEVMAPHSGLGLDCYVQWSSPIRRFGDLQCHAAVKRYLRRGRINQLMEEGKPLPEGIRGVDIGCDLPQVRMRKTTPSQAEVLEYDIQNPIAVDEDIDYRIGGGLIGAARQLQRASQKYWMFVYLQRMLDEDPAEAEFDCLVLGCIDPDRYQYAVYIHELGLEHRYLSQRGPLKAGTKLRLKVASVFPRTGLMTLTLAPHQH